MGFVNTLSGDFETITFEALSQTFINGVNGVLGPETWTPKGSVQGKFYIDSTADAVVSERFKVDVAGNILIDPEDLTFEIANTDRVKIGTTYYNVVKADNIALQEKVISLPIVRIE